MMEIILKQLKEIVRITIHNFTKTPPSDANLNILRQLGMNGLTLLGLDRKLTMMDLEKDFWHPPLEGYLKYNIDGASKGNSGIARYGGVIRNAKGNIVSIFHFHLGTATNNMAELMAME